MPSGMTAHDNQRGVDSMVVINTEIRTKISVKNAIPQHHPTAYPMEDVRGRGPSKMNKTGMTGNGDSNMPKA